MWQKSIRVAKTPQNNSKAFVVFHSLSCSQGWDKTEGQQLSDSSLLLFFLDVFVQHRAQRPKDYHGLLGIIHFRDRFPSLRPNQMVLQPLGREYSTKRKMWVCSCFLNSKRQPDWWNSAKPIASGIMQLASTANWTHMRDCWLLMDSPKESFPITGTPIREVSATNILFVDSEIFLPQKSSWVCSRIRESLLFCCSCSKILTHQQKDNLAQNLSSEGWPEISCQE